jgi:CRISPR system Cascade subunit CasD
MAEWLAFQLYGAMGSWGDIAVGEFRQSWDHPTRSAVIGLVCAALGIRRDEEERLAEVANGYRFSFRVNEDSIPVRDYHTTQVPSSGTGRNKKRFFTRKEELSVSEDQISTILSTRDYLCDCGYTVFLNSLPGAPYTLDEIKSHLLRPVFTLYLGRKSCPLSIPLHPQIFKADSLREACKTVPPVDLTGKKKDTFRIFWEEGVPAGITQVQVQVRRDHPISRSRWQFSGRDEYAGTLHSEVE